MWGTLRGGFGAEDALKAGANEVDPDYAFTVAYGFADVHDAALCFEVVLGATRKL